MKNFKYHFRVLVCSAFVLSFFHLGYADECQFNRAVYDVGSSGIKFQVATIDVCKKKILQVLFPKPGSSSPVVRKDVPFKANLKYTDDSKKFGTIPQETFDTALAAFKDLKASAENIINPETNTPYLIKDHVGTATEAFRIARSDSNKFFDDLLTQTGIKILIIEQVQEGELEYRAVLDLLSSSPQKVAPQSVISWGIGNGSMQIMGTDKDGKVIPYYLGNIAADGFFRRVLNDIKGADPAVTKTANPMSDNEIRTAIAMGEEIAQSVEKRFDIFDKLKDRSVEFYGLGGVLVDSIRATLSADRIDFNSSDLSDAFSRLMNKTDKQIAETLYADKLSALSPEEKEKAIAKSAKYAGNQLTSIALVYGFMKYFHISRVNFSVANPGNQIFFMPEFEPVLEGVKAKKEVPTQPTPKIGVQPKKTNPPVSKMSIKEEICMKLGLSGGNTAKSKNQFIHRPNNIDACIVNNLPKKDCDQFTSLASRLPDGIRNEAPSYCYALQDGKNSMMLYYPIR